MSEWQGSENPLFAEYMDFLRSAEMDNILAPPRNLAPGDALLVIDMQNDFVPARDKTEGGRFAVPEGDLIVPMIVQLIERTLENGGQVVATRDYHPVDHCSFMPVGHFPAHCVQGTVGSKFYPPIAKALNQAIERTGGLEGQPDGRVSVAYKGFHEDIDSFGGLPYVGGGEGRIAKRGSLMCDPFTGCSAAPWTGCIVPKCSGLCFDGIVDCDAPPDLLSASQDKQRIQDLVTKLKASGATRLLVCGLALDFCVADTAQNARELGFDDVVIVLDAARAANVPGLGTFGSGFLQDPMEVVGKWRNAGVRLTSTMALTGLRLPLAPPAPLRSLSTGSNCGGRGFPASVGPFGLERTKQLRITMDLSSFSGFELTFTGAMRALQGKLPNTGVCSSFGPITLPPEARVQANIPASAKTFSFAYPLAGILTLSADSRMGFLSADTDPDWRFLCYGGFLYFDAEGGVLAANAIGPGTDLSFGPSQPWRAEYTDALVTENRFQPVTLTNMFSTGARHFAWIHAGETLRGSCGGWEPATHGAFVYLFHDDPTATSPQDIFFPIVAA